ncbi:MAG: 2-phosphosulfolactate phosphatase [Roseiflexaceae bacterium]|nr:2-phosphosulfolactate phosphatase [Roseiflexus sp.]MDW8213382.1 2-phosphosulfolactate phosphatase [Roseiflexaceae bacterium]
MEIALADLQTYCGAAPDEAVVVIDVLRSFTTAAYLFRAGARTLLLAATPDEARVLAQRFPSAVTAGAVPGGFPIEGFDLGNSPAALQDVRLTGRDVVLCTAGGVRGAAVARHAALLLGGSLVCAAATARLLRRLDPPRVTLLITGVYADRDGDEDIACAEYLAAHLHGRAPDPAPFERRVRESTFGRRFGDPAYPHLSRADMDLCARADVFDFALPIVQQEGMMMVVRGNDDALEKG